MEQTQAASSPAEVDPFNGETPTLSEFQKYRETGEVPERFKPVQPADPGPAAAPEETVESEDEPESEPEEVQEHPQKGSGAEKRIKQLLAEKKELQRKLEAAAKQTQPDPSPAQAQQPPQNYAEYRQQFKPSKFIEDYAKAHPEASYEDANAAMADHLLDVRDHFRAIEQRVNAEKQALDAKVSEARERYEDFEEIKASFLGQVLGDKGQPLIPLEVLRFVNKSEVLPDLIYTIGSDEQATAKFVAMAKSDPDQALRYVARVESLIAEELSKPKEMAARGEDGKFAKAPEKRQTQAPKPPSPVGGTSKRGFDVSDESLSAEEWARQRNKQLGIG